MAYYNANGQITIDEAAASSDIQKIKAAVAKLEDSRNSLNQLKASASSMQGYTGQAIVEQSEKLTKQITDLVDKLNSSSSYIRKVVDKYKEQDRQLATSIKSGGGV